MNIVDYRALRRPLLSQAAPRSGRSAIRHGRSGPTSSPGSPATRRGLKKGMDACEQALADNPKHAEALVWHGSGLAFQAGAAFRTGDAQTGGGLWTRGMEEMDRAVSLEPDNVGVRIPRGALLLQATRFMQPDMTRPLIEKAVGDYEHVLELQSSGLRDARRSSEGRAAVRPRGRLQPSGTAGQGADVLRAAHDRCADFRTNAEGEAMAGRRHPAESAGTWLRRLP